MHESTKYPWPPLFRRLSSIFGQINTHFTFLSKHSRSTTPTADLIRKLNPDISLLDLSIIRELLPSGHVFFDYVDEAQLHLAIAEKVLFSWERGYKQSQAALDDAYEEYAHSLRPHRQLLVFDFNDTKLHGIGSALKKQRRDTKSPLPSELQSLFVANTKIQMVPLTLAQIMSMIQSRNRKFSDCITRYLSKFSNDEIATDTPWNLLIETAKAKVPRPPEFVDPVESLLAQPQATVPPQDPSSVSLDSMVAALKKKPFYREQILHTRPLNQPRDAIYKHLPPQADQVVHPSIYDALSQYRSISLESGLYSHQSEALEHLMFNEERPHVIVSTSTSSGKSLIYQLPIINAILWDITRNCRSRSSTALFIFPTKALAQDQKRHLQDFINYLPTNNNRKIIVETYDGDTPVKSRQDIKNFADIIFTNPDSIHASILPNHDSLFVDSSLGGWHEFLRGLKFVVADELHVYKGTFGIHVSYVMARLRRIVHLIRHGTEYESKITVQFVSCLATISKPESHFRTICAIPSTEKVYHVSQDGSPSAEKRLIVWNPPPLMNKKGGTQSTFAKPLDGKSVQPIDSRFIPRENIIPELARLLVHLLESIPTLRAIVFCPVRAICELMMKDVRAMLSSSNSEVKVIKPHEIMSYRGGYAKSDRRIIEQKMFSGEIRGIIATNALELGIDLSDLDVVISCGFPILKSNLHQQFGRGGRGRNSKGSLAIYVADASPVNQYYVKNPDELCRKSYEDLCVEALMDLGSNELIMEMHVQCAAFEWPIDMIRDTRWFLPDSSTRKANMFTKLCRQHLHKDSHGRLRTSPKYLPWPAEHVSLRLVEQTHYDVVDITNGRNVVIEEVEELRTSFTLYEGGIFLHQGHPYLVREFNTEKRYAKVERTNVDWTTSQRDFTDVDPLEIEFVKQLFPPNLDQPNDIPVYYGPIKSTIVVFGFFKVNKRSEILEVVEVNNPPIVLFSKGFWINIPGHVLEIIQDKKLSAAGGVHAAQHAIMNVLPLFISGGATTNPNAKFTSNVGESELITECKAPEKEFAKRQSNRKRPFRLIFRDSNGGARGLGISAKTFEYIDDILHTSFLRVKGCECEWGCPQCIAGGLCKEQQLVMSKPAALIILGALLGTDMSQLLTDLPDGPELNMPDIRIETIAQNPTHVKFSQEVEIVQVKRASKPLVKVKEDPDATADGDIALTAVIKREEPVATKIKEEEPDPS